MSTNTITIGRESNNQIVLNDPSNVTSRHHAVLTISQTGKMTILDSSANGTYVNGQRISPNIPVPVTRDDTINFAHAVTLDWSLVPKPKHLITYWGIGLAVVVVAVMCILFVPNFYKKDIASNDIIVDSTKCTVKFDANGGEGKMEPQIVLRNASTGLITNAFKREHFDFTGWNTKSDGTGIGYEDKAGVTFSDISITLYAQWKVRTHKVTFYGNNADAGKMNNFEVTDGEKTALPGNTYSRKGYKFKCWNTKYNGRGTTYADKGFVDITGDLKLYAQWEKDETLPELKPEPVEIKTEEKTEDGDRPVL